MASAEDVANQVDAFVDEALTLEEATLTAIGHAAQNIIILRTKQGLDADHRRFAPYSEEYAKYRSAKGRSSTTVDLAMTGHMQQASTVTVHGDEVALEFLNPREAIKAEAHNSGVDKPGTAVRAHTRNVYVNSKTGQRVSAGEARKDRRRKNKQVSSRTEVVHAFTRHQRLPKREWWDVRHAADVEHLEKAATESMEAEAEKKML